jgi:hypothetical protein
MIDPAGGRLVAVRPRGGASGRRRLAVAVNVPTDFSGSVNGWSPARAAPRRPGSHRQRRADGEVDERPVAFDGLPSDPDREAIRSASG